MYLEKKYSGFIGLKTVGVRKLMLVPHPSELKAPIVTKVWSELLKIDDPELNLSIVTLGLVYSVLLENTRWGGFYKCTVVMTLTSQGCPAGPDIILSIKNQLFNFTNIRKVSILITWNPFWDKKSLPDGIETPH
ncbi:MAG: iron-sulfur cluster assembly protein [Candidatus Organicella extenuata]|uniref:Iron-sulfur cluster assembly protein n=1 Tax=Candidatus Organicella extenuata TaxID=2841811 RepID=A0AA51GGU6_9BACT|nr:MAG: iron-sulfur cluster assembly protein [Candidatus Organicella extenuata]